MRKLLKRVISLALAVVMTVTLLQGFSIKAEAAGALSGLTVTDLTASFTDASDSKGSASWSASGNTITGQAKGYKQLLWNQAITTKLTLTNNKSTTATLTFDYTLVNGGSVKSDNVTMADGKYSYTLAAGASDTITLTSPSGTTQNTLAITNISLVKDVTVAAKFLPSENGSYTVNGQSITIETTLTNSSTTAYALKATPNSGYKFFGWYSKATSSYRSYSAEVTMYFEEDPQLTAVFISSSAAVFGVGASKFDDLQEAANVAQAGTIKQINLLEEGTIAGNYTIPAGVTLLIPFDSEYTCYKESPENTGYSSGIEWVNAVPTAWVPPTPYKTLTISKNSSIIVNGAISISAKHSSGNASGQATAGSPSGPYGYIKMESDSSITVNSGGKLYAWGYISGEGNVIANNGAEIYENFQFTDFRGGSVTSAMATEGKVFPLSQYYVQNIEVPTKFMYGSKEIVYGSVFMQKRNWPASVTFVGQDGMFVPEEGGSITKTYFPNTDRLQLDTEGSATIKSMSMDLGGTTYDSSLFALPLNSNISVNIFSGTTVLQQDMALLPGTQMTIHEGAELVINAESDDATKLIVYDREEWFSGYEEGTYGTENEKKLSDTNYVHVNVNHRPLSYSPTTGTKISSIRSESSLVDAVFTVNGTISVDGAFYTTLNGAKIEKGKGTGSITFNNGAGTDKVTLQANQDDSAKKAIYYDIPIISAKLHNGSEKFTTTDDAEKGAKYVWYDEENRWAKLCTITWKDWNGDVVDYDAVKDANGNLIVADDEDPIVYSGTTPLYDGKTLTKTPTAAIQYAFDGWTREADSILYELTDPKATENLPKVAKKDEVYTAHYSESTREYTVEWRNEDGTLLEKDEMVLYGTVPTFDQKTDPQKAPTADTSYIFNGWRTAEGTEPLTEIPAINVADGSNEATTGIITYYATYKSEDAGTRNYTVEWVTEQADGSITIHATENVTYSETPTAYAGATPTKTATAQYTYIFTGWDREVFPITADKLSETEVSTGIIRFTAVYDETVNKYTVKWLDDDGTTVLKEEQVEYGKTPAYGATPTKEATAQYTYTFKGWTPEVVSVTGDATYTAKYNATVNTYDVTFISDTGITLKTCENVAYGTKALKLYDGSEPTKASTAQYSYAFAGWKLNAEFITADTIIEGDVTYTAEFTPTVRSYTIKWVDEDGTTLDEQTLEYGATPEYEGATPTKAATAQYTYTFAGWSPEVTEVTGEETYTAEYDATVNTYTVTWTDEDGTVLETDTDVEYGVTPNFDSATPTKAATAQYTYSFAGWSPSIESVKGDTTYTATYTSTTNTYTVIWYDEDGITPLEKDEKVAYGETPSFDSATPTKEGDDQYSYTFTGWDKMIEPVTGNVSYKAVYEQSVNKYIITWYDEDCKTELSKEVLEYGVMPEYKGTTPTKAATAQYSYTHSGWTPSVSAVTKDQSYTAVYTPTVNNYTVTWVDDEGNKLSEEIVSYGTHADTLEYYGATPTKAPTAQYTFAFANWKDAGGAIVNGDTVVTGNVTYTAVFNSTLRSYKITWADEDGKELYSSFVEYGTTPDYVGETPTKAGNAQYSYSFAGWSPEVTAVTGEATYTATFTETVNTYTVTWYDENGTTVLDTDTVAYGDTPSYTGDTPTKEATAQYTYTFKGWTPEIESVTGDVSYNAVYEATVNTYDITWVNDDGTELEKDVDIAYGETPSYDGETPTKTATAQYSYTFAGWSPSVSTVTGEATYTATYTETVNKYTVTWENADGTVLETDKDVAYGTIPTYDAEIPTKAADAQYTYTFKGWTPEVSAVEGNATYTATYTETLNKYTVTWKNENGTVLENDEAVEYGTTPTYDGATPTKAATAQYTYTFAGWTPEVSAVEGNATYTATYTETVNEYTVTWVNEDGTPLDEQTLKYGVTPEYKGVTPTKAATAQFTYTFADWDKEISAVEGNVTYTATYTATTNAYTVTWTDEDGTVVETDENVLYGATPTYDGAALTKEEDETHYYVFDGWTPEVSSVTGNVTYQAVFKEVPKGQYTITFDTDGGSKVDTIVLYEGAEVEKPADPTKTGYTFAGWDADGDKQADVDAIPTEMPKENLTIKALWTINQYTITFDTKGGSEIAAIKQDYNSAVTAPAAPTKTGYTFTGWDKEVPTTMPAENVTLTAQWTINQYTITFDTDGGTEIAAITQNYNTAVTAPADPTRTGYTFAGWDVEVPDTMPAEDVTITANWTVNQYTITFNTNGGSEIASITQDYGTDVEAPANPSRTGYTFAGWDGTIPSTMPANNVTLTASWTINQYTINFNTDGGTEVTAITQDYNSKVEAPADPTKEGYTFAGWDTTIPSIMPASNMTITAKWTINQYEITFDTDGGTEVTAIKQDYGTVVVKPEDPTKEGYTFAGWTPALPSTIPATDMALKANWTINQYTITFNTAGGSKVDAITQDYGTAVVAPADPTREGYTFTGWDVSVPSTMPAGDLTITAQWDANEYTITFDTAGGNTIDPITQDYGTAVTRPANPTREGYTFTGWDVSVPTTMPAGDLTITAQWQINKYTITFVDPATGATITTITQDYGTDITAPADPTRTGYTFAGWDKEIPATMPAENVTITASWTINQYTIVFDTDGGSRIEPITQDYGTTITKPADPTKEGHTFTGWDIVIPGTMPARNMTAKAQWKVNQYTITFDTDGGSTVAAISQDYGTDITAPKDPTKTGYTFKGWDVEIPATMPAGDMTITAQWEINEYTFIFDTDGGSAIPEQKLVYGAEVTVPEDPTKTGYTFAGWDIVIPETMPASNMTAKAKWTVNQYTIRFNTDGGTASPAITQAYGTAVTAPENPTKSGYEFTGWDKAIPTTMPAEDVTITAQWSTNQYTITFDTDGGSAVEPIVQDFGTPITAPENPTKEGYSFAGWDVRVPSTMPAGNMTITAQWTVNQYTITFDTVGGTSVDVITQDYGTAIIPPEAPTKAGYTFAGWSPAIPEFMPAGDMTITAQWTTNQYTITFNTDGGSEVQPITQDYNTVITKPADPTKTGYTFNGWETEIPQKMPANNMTIKALWQINQYTITFDTDGGSAVDAITQDYATAVVAPADPTKDGYTFAGWETEIPETIPAENMTIKALWTINSYDVSWDTDGDGDVDDTTSVNYNEIPTHEDGSKEADANYTYTFTGWSPEISAVKDHITYTAQFAKTVNKYAISWDTDGDGDVDDITMVDYGVIPAHANGSRPTDGMYEYTFTGWEGGLMRVTGEKTYTAEFSSTPVEYTLTYDTDGGTSIGQFVVGYGAAIEKPADPEKTGYTFLGWDKEIPETMPAENVVITAQWQINQYTITFDINGGESGEIASITQDYATAVTAPEAPTRTGYTFAGWNPALPATMPAADMALSAQWQINKYTITYDTDGGSEVKAVTEDYGTKLPLPEEPTKEGHTFIGWDIETPRTMPAYNMTITALWEVNEYTITFVKEEGEEPYAEVTQNYGTDIEFPEDPEKEGYIFGGWSPEIGSKVPAEDITLEAVWNINQYTITFDTDGGNLISAIIDDYDAEITAPADPRKTGYTFIGWDKEIPEKMPAENMTIKALWQVNQYTITFDTDGGSEIAPITQDYDTKITLPENPTKPGYNFAGWDINIPARMPAVNLNAVAMWYIGEYTITFNTNGGTEVEPITAYYEDYLEEPEAPTKEGYAFAGWDQEFPETMPAGGLTLNAQWVALDYAISWDLDGDGTVDEVTMEPFDSVPTHADGAKAPILEYSYKFTGWSPEIEAVKGTATYTAQFEEIPNEFTIHFDTDGGSEVADMTCAYGAAAGEPEAPTKAGYTFTGWYPALPENMPAENITLVAQWKVNEYTIKFDTAGGTEVGDITAEFGAAISEPTEPTKEGYTFVGWDQKFPENMGSEDITLTAQWKVNQYTITFDTDGGSAIDPITQDYGSEVNEPEAPVKEHYEFLGWNIEIPDTMGANDITITAQWKYVYTGWMDEEDGTTYLITGQKEYYNEWAEIDGNSYFFDENSYIVKDVYKTMSADGSFKASFIFDTETGIFLEETNGLFDYRGNTYLAKDGYLVEYPGLVKVGDNYYYFNSSSVAIKDRKYWITKTNGLMLKGSYDFDETGKITNPAPFSETGETIPDGIVEKDGKLCYFLNGDLYYAGLIKIDGDYYYVKSTGELVTDARYWITKTNGMMPQGSYIFDEEGKITNPKVYPTAVSLSKNEISINKGKTYTLKSIIETDVENAEVVTRVTWTTSNKKVATVNSNGRITAVAAGKATITATTANGMTATCEVTVLVPATKVTLNKTSLTINTGKTYQLRATMTPKTTTDTLTWVSSNENVVTVSEDGKVTAVGKGKATITVKTTSGKKAVCRVTVK